MEFIKWKQPDKHSRFKKSGNNSIIKILYYDDNDYPNNPTYWNLKDSTYFLAVTGHYDDINCSPVIGLNQSADNTLGAINIIYKGLDGLYFQDAELGVGLPGINFGITLIGSPTKINGTNSNSVNPSIFATKAGTYYAQLVWEESNTIKYHYCPVV